MDLHSFTYRGYEYQVDKVTEIEHKPGEKCFQICTKDNKVFLLTYNSIIHQWVVNELSEIPNV